jgi:hypothetical protein
MPTGCFYTILYDEWPDEKNLTRNNRFNIFMVILLCNHLNHHTMKTKELLLVFLLIAQAAVAQVPGKFNYQAIVRNSDGQVVAGETVAFRISILAGDVSGEALYTEEQIVTTNDFGMAVLLIGDQEGQRGLLGDIDWTADTYFIRIEVDRSGTGTEFVQLGTSQLISVPYAMASASLSSPTRKFTVQAEPGHDPEEALFEVVNQSGQVLFAVYPEGTRIYVDDSNSKGLKGGFAVGGYVDDVKGITQEFLRVTPDSVRIYVRDTPAKGVKGGFAVGGYVDNKAGSINPHLFVNKDSTDVYTEDPVSGGFSVKLAQSQNKAGKDRIMSVRTENSYVGFEAGYANRAGKRNSYVGYQAGYNNLSGNDNVFIGPSSGFKSLGSNNVYIGSGAGATNQAGINNIFIGNQAGILEDGSNRLYIESGEDADFSSALIYGEFDTDKVRINSSLGIGVTPDAYTFEVDGTVAKSDPEDWATISDYRVKREIREIRDACSTIMKLRPVTYKYTKDWVKQHPTLEKRNYYNFIAQEFNEVFPEAVHQVDKYIEGDDDPLYEMNSQPASVVAIRAIQELIVENRKQQEVIDRLQQENRELQDIKRRLERLEEGIE